MKYKNHKPRHFKLKLFISLISIYCIWNIISTQVEINNKSYQLEDIKNRCSFQASQNNEYKNILLFEIDNDYINRVAREKLGFISQDDRVFIDISSK